MPRPSNNQIKQIKRLGSGFVGTVLCRQLSHYLNAALSEAELTVAVRPETLRNDVPDKDPRRLYVFFPSLFLGRYTDCNSGVVTINCSFLAAAEQTV